MHVTGATHHERKRDNERVGVVVAGRLQKVRAARHVEHRHRLRVFPPSYFRAVWNPVAIAVHGHGRGSEKILAQIGETVAVRVAGGIDRERIKPVQDFPSVRHPVAVRIGVHGVCSERHFLSVKESISVHVGYKRVGMSGQNLLGIQKTVKIGVGPGRIGAGSYGILDRQTVLREFRSKRPRQIVELLARFPRPHPAALNACRHIHVPECV